MTDHATSDARTIPISLPGLPQIALPSLAMATLGATVLALLARRAPLPTAYGEWLTLYHVALPLLLLAALPWLLTDLRRRGFDLRREMVDRSSLGGDVAVGLAAGIVGLVAAVLWVHTTGWTISAGTSAAPTWIAVVGLGLVAPFVKEIVFRFYPVRVLEPETGAFVAFLVGTLAFALFDWQNLGASFVAGSVWYAAYRWRGRLVVAILAHATTNLLAIALS